MMASSEQNEWSSKGNGKNNVTVSLSDTNQLSRATLSTISTRSSGISCRICQDNHVPEPLIAPCHCMGTIAYIHSSCLEKWLSQTARNNCELCKFEFPTIMKMKGFRQWICANDITRIQRRYMFADSSCFMLLTPLGLISAWLCIKGAQQYYSHDDFWTGFGLILLTGFLSLLYVFWFGITLRYHYKTFRKWQRQHAEVQLVFTTNNTSNTSNSNANNNKKEASNRDLNDEGDISISDFHTTSCVNQSSDHVIRVCTDNREDIRLV